jgi:signal transduction histidine kinase/CheY-like chemotaxis protein
LGRNTVRHQAWVLLLTLTLAFVIGFFDWITGTDISFSLFYYAPVVLAVWYGSLPLGLILVAVVMADYIVLDFPSRAARLGTLALYWNIASRTLVYLLVTVLVEILRRSVRRTEEALGAAVEASRAKSAFLATMSHEIRTPLNALLGTAELLDRSPLDGRQRAWVKVFRREGNHLLELVNDLLDIGKIEAGQFDLDPGPVDLGELLEQVQSVFGVRAREAGVTFEIGLSPTLPRWVVTDGQALRRILFNLAGNAVKFTSQGGISIEASDRPAGPARELVLTVADTGMGIPPDRLPGLFVPYVQAHGDLSARLGGTGLGLSIVKTLLDLLGGRITVESRPGEGSRFTVVLPLVEAASGPAPTSRAVPETLPGPGSLVLLLADDYPLNRSILKEFLAETGAEIVEAGDGRRAADLVRDRNFSLVLMDLKMPVLDGLEAVREIRTHEVQTGKPRTPVVALTAQAYPEDARLALAAGFDAHVAKPISRDQLLATVSRWARPVAVSGVVRVPASLRDLTEQYRVEVRAFARDLAGAWASGDWTAAETVGHRLRGTGSSFGFPLLTEIGTALEAAAAAQDGPALGQACDRLNTYLEHEEVLYE